MDEHPDPLDFGNQGLTDGPFVTMSIRDARELAVYREIGAPDELRALVDAVAAYFEDHPFAVTSMNDALCSIRAARRGGTT